MIFKREVDNINYIYEKLFRFVITFQAWAAASYAFIKAKASHIMEKSWFLLLFSLCVYDSIAQCDTGMKTCDLYPWDTWSTCTSTCGGTRQRYLPVCCDQRANTLNECLQLCNFTRQWYDMTKIQKEKCGDACTSGEQITKQCKN